MKKGTSLIFSQSAKRIFLKIDNTNTDTLHFIHHQHEKTPLEIVHTVCNTNTNKHAAEATQNTSRPLYSNRICTPDPFIECVYSVLKGIIQDTECENMHILESKKLKHGLEKTRFLDSFMIFSLFIFYQNTQNNHCDFELQP